jgi:hypothetical protein
LEANHGGLAGVAIIDAAVLPSERSMSDVNKLSDSDKRKLAELEAELEQGGIEALRTALRRLDSVTYLRIVGHFFPREVAKAVDDASLDAGLTLYDLRRMLKEAKSRH